jgi:hypothetical protein
MNPSLLDPSDSTHWEAILETYHARMAQLQKHASLGKRALSVSGWDWKLWQLGRAWLRANGAPCKTESGAGGDVYLATQLYANGGHTALIGDFIRAQDTKSHIIVTNVSKHNKPTLPDPILSRLGVTADQVSVLTGTTTLLEKLAQLMELLQRLRPRRLFLFHHPDDPLASVVAQPELAGQCVMVHHADGTPSFGLHLPGVQLIELNPIATAMSRQSGLEPACLMLTSPDPGPRPGGFLQRGKLVTASSGSQHKFTKPYAYGYAETLAKVLGTTAGWHLHIGPLDAVMLSKIHDTLQAEQVPADRFIHVPWAPSVAACLWEHQCDVYLSSFPTDGARTNAEVLASGTPHLRHKASPTEHWIDGGLAWKTWVDLTETLRNLESASVLLERSKMMRRTYEKQHHPAVFAQTLQQILTTGQGMEDETPQRWDAHIVRSLLKTHTATLIRQTERMDKLEASLAQSLAMIQALQTERAQWTEGTSLRAKLLRWLMKPMPRTED